MTDPKMETAKSDEAMPEELNDQTLDDAAGGYGRRTYYSYDSDAATSFSARTDDSTSN